MKANKGPHPNGGGRKQAKPKNMKAAMKRLFGYMGCFRRDLILAVCASVLATGCSLAAPYMMARALDTVQNRLMNQTSIDFRRLGWALAILSLLYLLNAALTLAQGNIMTQATQKTLFRLRQDTGSKMMRLPLSYFDTHKRGDILSRTTNDIDAIGTALQQAMAQLVPYLITIVGSILLMAVVNLPLTLLCLLTVPASMFTTRMILKRSQGHIRGQMQAAGMLSGIAEETFSGMHVVKAFGCEEEMLAKFDAVNDQFCEAATKGQFISASMNPTATMFNNLAYIFISTVGACQVIAGTISLGDIMALVQYQKQYASPLTQLMSLIGQLQQAAAAAERVFEFLDEQEETESRGCAVLPAEVRGEVEFSHLKFGYTPDKLLMNDIDVHVQAGQKVAIVGPTGAGKTTLINLLLRFYEINGGSILVDGVDTCELTRAELRRCFGIVLQDTWLFGGTIRENLKYGNAEIAEEELLRVSRETQADYFISAMPEGYETQIREDGDNVSQGQKQLLTIARAMAANPAILILDEATSNVDNRTEAMIQTAMTRLMKGRTSFVIAHRLSTIQDADQILVMKAGNIVEQGTHETLLARGGLYTQLYNSQFEQS